MKKSITVIGIGPGSKSLITRAGEHAISAADVLIGGRRHLALFGDDSKLKIEIKVPLSDVYQYIEEHAGHQRIAVLASGDPGLFSIASAVAAALPHIHLNVIPGISSLQYLCARAGSAWNDLTILTLHGQDDASLESRLQQGGRFAVFTDPDHSPDAVARRIQSAGIAVKHIIVGEDLSLSTEKITMGNTRSIAEGHFAVLSLMIIETTAHPPSFFPPGLPDDAFIRGNVPMTKEEIRALSVSKLRIRHNSIVWDIGAGTGSVSCECAMLARNGKVYAMDRSEESVSLIKQNAGHFGLVNIEVLLCTAPDGFETLPIPDRIFIGGSGGMLGEILEAIVMGCKAQRLSFPRIVLNAITLETAYLALTELKRLGFTTELIHASIAKGISIGSSNLLKAQNPIFIITGWGRDGA